ncbi:unnamed protein product [Phytomonas sp. Hart1]|nr:unnamed protein product [Phytomonas sp. Hart1]|eukprot:CCW71860.1 unnamed protein product [Phytomonas sp. isolate Hart1]
MAYVDTEEKQKKEEKWRLSRQQIIQHQKKSLLFTPFSVGWVPNTASVAVVGQYPNNHGALSFFRLDKGELDEVVGLRVEHPLKCGTFGHAGQDPATFAVGDFVGGLRVMDVERLGELTSERGKVCDLSPASTFHAPHAHGSIINAIDGARGVGPPEIATGSRDGGVRVWDARQPERPVVSLNPADPARARDCWTVRLGNGVDPDERVLAAGYDNGDVKLFDLRTQRMVHEMSVSNGVCDLEFDRADIEMNKLIISCLEGRVRCYDLRTRHPKLGFAYVEERVSDGTVWCSRALPQNREVFISGGGGDLTLCRYQYPPERSLKDQDGLTRGVAGAVEELNKAKIGDQPINAIDWNRSKEGLLACTSFDQSLRIVLVSKLSLLS